MARKLLPLAALMPLLGACNMVISDTPMFDAADRGQLLPRDGIWLGDDEECRFDHSNPEKEWPECAGWLVVRDAGREIWMQDGKGQSERGHYLIAGGTPPVVQVKYTDRAKEDGKTFYVYFGLEPGQAAPDGRFATAFTWPVECGVEGETPSDIKPFPGITPACRPLSKEAIRSAAQASRQTADEGMKWRWLRAEAPKN